MYQSIKLFTALILFGLLPFSASAQDWTELSSGTTNILKSVHFINSGTGWTVGSIGIILKTTDAGETWVEQTSGTGNTLESVFFTDANNGWVSDANGSIFHSDDGGATWSEQTNLGYAMKSLYFVSETTGWAVGQQERIYHTNDGGENWTLQHSTSPGVFWNDVFFFDNNNGWAVGDDGTFIKTEDGGATWTKYTTGVNYNLSGVQFTSATEGHISTFSGGGSYLKSTDGGETWTENISGLGVFFHEVHYTTSSTGWAVGSSGIIHETTDGGDSWDYVDPAPVSTTLLDVYFPSETMGYIVGESGVILRMGSTAELTETEENSHIVVYPNPSTESISIQSDEQFSSIIIRDMSGRTVIRTDLSESIDVIQLGSGQYIIEANTLNGSVYRTSFIKE